MDQEPKEPLVRSMWHELYLELQSNPLDQRTDIVFCEENKIAQCTLSVWKRKNRKEIYDEVQRRRGQYVNEMRAIGYKHLNRMCVKDINAVKLLFQLCGDLVEKTHNTVEYMSRQDRIDRVNSLLRDAQSKSEQWKKIQAEADKSTGGNPGTV